MIRKEDCDSETLDAIFDRCVRMIQDGTFSPENASAVIKEEYCKQIIRTGKDIEFPDEKGENNETA